MPWPSWFGAGLVAAGLLGQPFPSLSGRALTGEAVALPQALRAKPALLLLGFSPMAGADAERWARWAAARYAAGGRVAIYLVVVVEGPPFLAPLVDGLFRAQTDARLRAHAITVYDPGKTLRGRFGVGDDRAAQVYGLDDAGVVRASALDGFSPEAAEQLARRLEASGRAAASHEAVEGRTAPDGEMAEPEVTIAPAGEEHPPARRLNG